MIPVASSTLSVPPKPGTTRWLATSPALGLAYTISSREGGEHDSGEHGDAGLESPEPQLLQTEDREGARARDQPGGE